MDEQATCVTTSCMSPIIPMVEVKRFIFDCMKAVNTPEEYAHQMADLLSEADYRGHFSHGMNRLGSNHYGICGKYASDAMKEGFIQFNCTNTSPLSVPTRAKTSFFGTNPFALGAPANNDQFLLDMATTTVAVGKIEVAVRKGAKIPETWALNVDGIPETDAQKAYDAAKLSPLGGPEHMGGYKGSGLLFMVEVLSGILSGSKSGPHIERWGKLTEPANLGHCFIVINPECFAPGFQGRLEDILNELRSCPPVDPEKPVMAAGDPERKHMKAVDEAGGVRYVKNQIETCWKLSQRLKVNPLRPLSFDEN